MDDAISPLLAFLYFAAFAIMFGLIWYGLVFTKGGRAEIVQEFKRSPLETSGWVLVWIGLTVFLGYCVWFSLFG